jgi:hypothetical protein
MTCMVSAPATSLPLIRSIGVSTASLSKSALSVSWKKRGTIALRGSRRPLPRSLGGAFEIGKGYLRWNITLGDDAKIGRYYGTYFRKLMETMMQRTAVALVGLVLAASGSSEGQALEVGRYQMVAVPASQSQTFPQTLLLDTVTGQTWILYHETGQSIEWLPLRFSAGKDRPGTPLPPSPDAVGVSR